MKPAQARQLCALGFGAASVSAVLMLPQVGWFWATLGAIAAAGLLYIMCRLRRGVASPIEALARGKFGRAILCAIAAGNFVLLGLSAYSLCDAYPTAGARPLIGLVLLLLAAFAAGKGTAAVGRVAAIAFFFFAALYAVVLGFGATQIEAKWLRPVTRLEIGRLSALLAPTGALLLSARGREKALWPWLLGGVATVFAASFVTAGVVSSGVACAQPFAFYTLGKNISLFGAMERLEPLISVALTLSGFSLLAVGCAVNCELAAALGAPKNFMPTANFLLGGGAALLAPQVPNGVAAVLCATFWGALPLCALLVVYADKNKKI